MKLQPVAQNILEWVGLKLGLVPTPLAWSHFGFMASKFLLEAVDKGVLESIGYNNVTVEHIAQTCQLNIEATHGLLSVLATMGLIKENGGTITLQQSATKWLLKDSPNSLYWLMIFDNRVCLKWMDHTGPFLQSGKGLQYHETFTPEEWFYYQKAMEAVARTTSTEAAGKLPVPKNAETMLDIGGAHGLYSVALCKKHGLLSSTILDLPGAVDKAAPILAQYNMQGRIKHQAGNILSDDIGTNLYDYVLMASVAHHFTVDENRLVAQKVYNALKPGGVFTIMEVLSNEKIIYNGDMLNALGNLFFALSSTSGAWSFNQIKEWQTAAGFQFYKKRMLLSIPGYATISGKR